MIDYFCNQHINTKLEQKTNSLCLNVTKLKDTDLPKIDLLIGGSPCQSFSSAGSRAGFDGKSKLFWEFIRVLNEVK